MRNSPDISARYVKKGYILHFGADIALDYNTIVSYNVYVL